MQTHLDPFPSTHLRLHADGDPAACQHAVEAAMQRRLYQGYPRTLGDRLKTAARGFSAPGWNPVQGSVNERGFAISRSPAGALATEARGTFVPEQQGTTVLVRVGATLFTRCYLWALVAVWVGLSIGAPFLQGSVRSLSDLPGTLLWSAIFVGLLLLTLVGLTYRNIRASVRADTPFLLAFVREALGDTWH